MTRQIPTPEQIEAFNEADLMEGHPRFHPGDPEPGHNHSDAYWWGWWAARNPRLETDDAREVEMYWAMRRYARYKMKAP